MNLQAYSQFNQEVTEAMFLPIHLLNKDNFRYPVMLPKVLDLFNSIE
jgi:hypothetical protein